MRSPLHSLTKVVSAGKPLPDRFDSLAVAGIKFRCGQVHMICGQPGSGKSLVSLDYVANAGVSALYFSADSDDATVVARLAAMKLGYTVDEVEAMLKTSGRVLIEEALAELQHVKFVYASSPSLDDIDEELKAFIEVFGEPPAVIVFDNLINIPSDTGDEWQGLRQLMLAMNDIARDTGSAVIVLHHTSEGEGQSNLPQPRKSIHGKVNQIPAVILTVANDPDENTFMLSAVKNRSGPADPKGKKFTTLSVDFARMTLSERNIATTPDFVRDYWEQVQ